MIKVKNERIPEEEFLKMREKVLSLWPTGKEVDLDEAVEYNLSLPEDKNMAKMLAKLKAEGKTTLFPRSGTPVVEE